jgi:hypothetical protein
MSETITLEQFVDTVYRERGGEDAFSVVQKRLVAVLASALKDPTDVDVQSVARILSELPPVVTRQNSEIVPSLCTDDELRVLDGYFERVGTTPAPPPVGDAARIAELIEQNATLAQTIVHQRARIESSETACEAWERKWEERGAEYARLAAQLDEVKAAISRQGVSDIGQSEKTHHGPRQGLTEASSDRSSNVVPLTDAQRVNAPIVSLPLRERYPDVDFGPSR